MAYKVKATGRWAAQGRNAAGKKVQLGTCATKGDALKLEAAHKRKVPTSDMTISEWRGMWLARSGIEESTRAHNRERTQRFNDTYGDETLTGFKRRQAREWVDQYPATQPALSSMFGAAMYEDDEYDNPLLTVNVFAKLVKTKVKKRDLAPEWLTLDEVEQIFDVADNVIGPWAKDMLIFAAETNLRPGELFVVGESDLDAKTGLVMVRWAADSKTKIIKRPKSGRPDTAVLSRRAHAAATRQIERQAPTKLRIIQNEKLRKTATAAELEPTLMLWPNPSGDQFWNSTWTYYWHQIRAAAGRPDLDFYELVRHYGATRLREAGLEDADAGAQLRHNDGGELVRKVYGHPSRRAALERVRQVLDKEEK